MPAQERAIAASITGPEVDLISQRVEVSTAAVDCASRERVAGTPDFLALRVRLMTSAPGYSGGHDARYAHETAFHRGLDDR
jgi:hypothetical protein